MQGPLLKTKQNTRKAEQATPETECSGDLIHPAALILEVEEDVSLMCALPTAGRHRRGQPSAKAVLLLWAKD